VENMRLFFRSFDAASAVDHFSGFLPTIMTDQVMQSVCELQAGQNISDSERIAELIEHKVLVERDGAYYSKVPLLTSDFAKQIRRELAQSLPKSQQLGQEQIRMMAESDPELWQDSGHVVLSQLILGLLWYKMWQDLADDPHAPAAVIVADIDLTPAFMPGIYPLYGNQSISYWQSSLLGHPDTIHDILHHPNVVKSLQSMNNQSDFIPIDNVLVLLKSLNMYKTRPGENKLPMPYVTLPTIDQNFVKQNQSHLQKCAELFYNITNTLTAITQKIFAERCTVMQAVEYDYFRQMVYLVFCHHVMAIWQDDGLLPEENRVRDRKKINTAPQWRLAR